jgi:hypothetical protein
MPGERRGADPRGDREAAVPVVPRDSRPGECNAHPGVGVTLRVDRLEPVRGRLPDEDLPPAVPSNRERRALAVGSECDNGAGSGDA